MKKLILSAIALLVLASCNKNDNIVDTPYDNEVHITSGIATRTTGDTWDANDKIGVYMNAAGGTLGTLGANIQHETTAGDGNFTVFTSAEKLFYPTEGNVDLLAYYPYKENINATAYAVNIATQSDQGAIDLMIAKKTNAENSANAVNLIFEHKLSKLQITIELGDGLNKNEFSDMVVTLVGTTTMANYDLTKEDNANPISLSGTTTEVTLKTVANELKAEGIVVPQSLSGAKFKFTTAIHGTFEADITTEKFDIGKQYKYIATLNRTGVTLNAGTITAWNKGNGESGENLNALAPPVKLADYYYSDDTWSTGHVEGKTPIGVVFSVGSDGKSGKIVSLEEVSGNWSTGKNWADNYNKGGKDWYFPSSKELRELYAGSSGLQWIDDASGSGTINNSTITDWGNNETTMTDYSNAVYKNNRTNFNNILKNSRVNNAAEITVAFLHWSYTSADGYGVLVVYLSNGKTQYDNQAVNYARTRAVFAF